MRRFALKALFTVLNLNKGESERPDWQRWITIFSTGVTIGLVAIYAWGKSTSRW
jgi:hypothetical protein